MTPSREHGPTISNPVPGFGNDINLTVSASRGLGHWTANPVLPEPSVATDGSARFTGKPESGEMPGGCRTGLSGYPDAAAAIAGVSGVLLAAGRTSSFPTADFSFGIVAASSIA